MQRNVDYTIKMPKVLKMVRSRGVRSIKSCLLKPIQFFLLNILLLNHRFGSRNQTLLMWIVCYLGFAKILARPSSARPPLYRAQVQQLVNSCFKCSALYSSERDRASRDPKQKTFNWIGYAAGTLELYLCRHRSEGCSNPFLNTRPEKITAIILVNQNNLQIIDIQFLMIFCQLLHNLHCKLGPCIKKLLWICGADAESMFKRNPPWPALHQHCFLAFLSFSPGFSQKLMQKTREPTLHQHQSTFLDFVCAIYVAACYLCQCEDEILKKSHFLFEKWSELCLHLGWFCAKAFLVHR